jgi:hypothetical protein
MQVKDMSQHFQPMTDLEMQNLEGAGFWKCALGTVGSAGLGFLTGKSLNPKSWAYPIPPGPVGAVSGALVGAATFCFD